MLAPYLYGIRPYEHGSHWNCELSRVVDADDAVAVVVGFARPGKIRAGPPIRQHLQNVVLADDPAAIDVAEAGRLAGVDDAVVVGVTGARRTTPRAAADNASADPRTQYVADLEFVQDPGPDQPIWSPD